MGEHKLPKHFNGDGRGDLVPMRPAVKMPKAIYGYNIETAIELNAATMAEVVAIIDEAKARGMDPRQACPAFDAEKEPERFDYVVYRRATVGRPSALLPNPNQVPTALIRLGELERMPLTELLARADAAFAEQASGAAEKH